MVKADFDKFVMSGVDYLKGDVNAHTEKMSNFSRALYTVMPKLVVIDRAFILRGYGVLDASIQSFNMDIKSLNRDSSRPSDSKVAYLRVINMLIEYLENVQYAKEDFST